jgi:osmotically-inducible protein OsmY
MANGLGKVSIIAFGRTKQLDLNVIGDVEYTRHPMGGVLRRMVREPDRIRAEIDSALVRHAVHVSNRVKIEVQADRVILKGEVPSWAERKAIIGAVKGTPGVRKIETDLRIQA